MGFSPSPEEMLVGLVILISIFAMFGWLLLFRSRSITRGRNSQNLKPNLLIVAVTGSASSARTVELAARLAVNRRAKIILTHVIEVPLKFRLDAPLPQLEDNAQSALAGATQTVKEYGLEYETRVIRDRTAAGGLVELARETSANLVVIGFDGLLETGMSDLLAVSELFRHAPCQVVVAREAIAKQPDGLHMGRLIEPQYRS